MLSNKIHTIEVHDQKGVALVSKYGHLCIYNIYVGIKSCTVYRLTDS